MYYISLLNVNILYPPSLLPALQKSVVIFPEIHYNNIRYIELKKGSIHIMAEKRIAQYKQIENDLLQKINLGYYKKDDLIPTELELSNT